MSKSPQCHQLCFTATHSESNVRNTIIINNGSGNGGTVTFPTKKSLAVANVDVTMEANQRRLPPIKFPSPMHLIANAIPQAQQHRTPQRDRQKLRLSPLNSNVVVMLTTHNPTDSIDARTQESYARKRLVPAGIKSLELSRASHLANLPHHPRRE